MELLERKVIYSFEKSDGRLPAKQHQSTLHINIALN